MRSSRYVASGKRSFRRWRSYNAERGRHRFEKFEQTFRKHGAAFFPEPPHTQPFERKLRPIFLPNGFGEPFDASGLGEKTKDGSAHDLSPTIEHIFEDAEENRGGALDLHFFPYFPNHRVFRRFARLDRSSDRDEEIAPHGVRSFDAAFSLWERGHLARLNGERIEGGKPPS